jgi:hypothetical protein
MRSPSFIYAFFFIQFISSDASRFNLILFYSLNVKLGDMAILSGPQSNLEPHKNHTVPSGNVVRPVEIFSSLGSSNHDALPKLENFFI